MSPGGLVGCGARRRWPGPGGTEGGTEEKAAIHHREDPVRGAANKGAARRARQRRGAGTGLHRPLTDVTGAALD